MSLTAAWSGFVVVLLSVQGTVRLHLYTRHLFVFRYIEVFKGQPTQSWVRFLQTSLYMST